MKKSVIFLSLFTLLLFVSGAGLVAAEDSHSQAAEKQGKASCCSDEKCTCKGDCCGKDSCDGTKCSCNCQECKSGSCAGKESCAGKKGGSCAKGKNATCAKHANKKQ